MAERWTSEWPPYTSQRVRDGSARPDSAEVPRRTRMTGARGLEARTTVTASTRARSPGKGSTSQASSGLGASARAGRVARAATPWMNLRPPSPTAPSRSRTSPTTTRIPFDGRWGCRMRARSLRTGYMLEESTLRHSPGCQETQAEATMPKHILLVHAHEFIQASPEGMLDLEARRDRRMRSLRAQLPRMTTTSSWIHGAPR